MKTTIHIIDKSTHHHYHGGVDPALREVVMSMAVTQVLSLTILKEIRMSIEQLRSDLTALQSTQAATLQAVTKISGETTALVSKVAELQAAIDNGAQVPDDVRELVADLTAQANAVNEALAGVDALVPDAAEGGGGEEQPQG